MLQRITVPLLTGGGLVDLNERTCFMAKSVVASSLSAGMMMMMMMMGASLVANDAAAQALAGSGPPSPLLNAMIGRCDVKQTMWAGPDLPPIKQPPAVAVRRLAVGGGYVEEEMTPVAASGDPFTRTSHINYNAIDGVFEYFSIDTRSPQQMHCQSQPVASDFRDDLQFQGGTFVAGQWGLKVNAAFAYRVELSPVSNDRQTMQFFLRPLAAGTQREFEAFRYEYRKR